MLSRTTFRGLCFGLAISLFSFYVDVYANHNPDDYVINQSGMFSPLPGSGTFVQLSDDDVSSALPIGFDFNFFGNTYNTFYISSNGFITFNNDNDNGCCSGDELPNSSPPNNLIAFAWEDLDPPEGGNIQYFTTGPAPNRRLVVNFNDIQHFPNGFEVKTQVVLHELTNLIEIHTTDMPSNGDDHTMGIENSDGTIAYTVNGRNSESWSASDELVQFFQPSHLLNDAGVVSVDSPKAVIEKNGHKTDENWYIERPTDQEMSKFEKDHRENSLFNQV